MKTLLRVLVTCLFLAMPVLPALADDAPDKKDWPDQLRFMAGPPGGNWSALGVALAGIWSDAVISTSSSSGGGVANIINANSRRGDLGFSVTSFLGAAMKGEEAFQDMTVDNAVIMSNLYTQVVYFILNKEFAEKNGIRTVGDLLQNKVRFATLKPGTASEFAVKALFRLGYDTDTGKLKDGKRWSVEYVSYEDGADRMADNQVDCLAFSVGSVASIVMDIERRLDVVILEVEREALDAVAEAYGTTTHTIRPGIYASVSAPTRTLGDYTCVVIRKDLPESLVFALNKALWDNREGLIEAVLDMRELDSGMALPAGVPSHPGSESFWNSVK